MTAPPIANAATTTVSHRTSRIVKGNMGGTWGQFSGLVARGRVFHPGIAWLSLALSATFQLAVLRGIVPQAVLIACLKNSRPNQPRPCQQRRPQRPDDQQRAEAVAK